MCHALRYVNKASPGKEVDPVLIPELRAHYIHCAPAQVVFECRGKRHLGVQTRPGPRLRTPVAEEVAMFHGLAAPSLRSY